MRFILFGCIWDRFLPYNTQCKTGQLVQLFVPQSRIGIFRNERTRSTPLDPKLMFWSVFYNLGAFGTVWLPYQTRCKTGRTGAKVHATKSHRNFSQLKHPIRPIVPQTHILVRFVLFGCIWEPYNTQCKTGQTGAKVRATKSRWNFSQRTHPIHPIGP